MRTRERRQNSLFTTLAYHLAYYYPVIAERITVALEEDPEVVERDPIQQFNRSNRQASPNTSRRRKSRSFW